VTDDFDPKYSAKTVSDASVDDQLAFMEDNNLTLPTNTARRIQREIFVDFGIYVAIVIIGIRLVLEVGVVITFSLRMLSF